MVREDTPYRQFRPLTFLVHFRYLFLVRKEIVALARFLSRRRAKVYEPQLRCRIARKANHAEGRSQVSLPARYSCDDDELLIGGYESQAKHHRRAPPRGDEARLRRWRRSIRDRRVSDQSRSLDGRIQDRRCRQCLRGFDRRISTLAGRASVRFFPSNLPTSTSMGCMKTPLKRHGRCTRKKLNRTHT